MIELESLPETGTQLSNRPILDFWPFLSFVVNFFFLEHNKNNVLRIIRYLRP